MKGIVDRIENRVVIVEIEDEYIDFDLGEFPREIKEGDIVEYRDGIFSILVDETLIREKKIRTLFDSLLEKDD